MQSRVPLDPGKFHVVVLVVLVFLLFLLLLLLLLFLLLLLLLFICNSLVASVSLIDMLFALRLSVLFCFSFDLILIDFLPFKLHLYIPNDNRGFH